ncbi:MAG TPA: F0F1 ATP synthase subunit alpha [Candidatus Babeliales bacterium]|nr:F0F1 ATP synthase subunit alpha [Candidatus Babeliales bacterium]
MKNTDLISLFERSLRNLPEEQLEEIGTVIRVGDNICIVYGLANAMLGELINFEGGNSGIIFQLNENSVAIFLINRSIPVAELETAKRSHSLFKTPVGMELLGRVINAEGIACDGAGELTIKEFRPIETEISGIMERSPINEPLETGILAIDVLVPIGKGQRELIVGNRNTGKSSLIMDTILHQKGKDVICIYVSIGQRQANLARFVSLLEQNGALDYSVVISADAGDAVLNQYLAPYVGCTIAEYFRDQGKDVLIVYDDLSNHAIAFREMSLLLRRSPGREAYPGDVFYLHSRLLERAGKLAKGGSITALPIVQIQGDDITAYIPTNLISITDGQIFLDTKLFNQGIRPAVNAELSVSRVGGSAQTKAVKKMTRALRLELAQYQELLAFAQFGAELDETSHRQLERGRRVIELLKQSQYVTFSFVDQALMLLFLKEGLLDTIELNQINTFALQCISYIKSVYPSIYTTIAQTEDISDDIGKQVHMIAAEFIKLFIPING